MINLAGRKDCDGYIRNELTRARVELVEHEQVMENSEVPARLTGKLGKFKFTRAWYYWIVDGDVPIDVARVLWQDPEGQATVRASGRAGGSDPDNHVRWFDADGRILQIDETGKEETETTYHSDYKDVQGMKTPMKLKTLRDGKPFLDAEVTEITYHEKLDDAVFARP